MRMMALCELTILIQHFPHCYIVLSAESKHHKKDMLQEELLETFLNGPFWLLSFFCFLAGTVTGIVEV